VLFCHCISGIPKNTPEKKNRSNQCQLHPDSAHIAEVQLQVHDSVLSAETPWMQIQLTVQRSNPISAIIILMMSALKKTCDGTLAAGTQILSSWKVTAGIDMTGFRHS
jgi:hypothetical protein